MKILVTCAHGTATGPIMKAKVEQVLQEYGIPFETIHHCAISEAKTLAPDYDIIFCATSFASIFKNAAAAGTTVIGMRNILSLEESASACKTPVSLPLTPPDPHAHPA